jgi:hypothetical protein
MRVAAGYLTGHRYRAWPVVRASAALRVRLERSRDHLSTESSERKGEVLWTFQEVG